MEIQTNQQSCQQKSQLSSWDQLFDKIWLSFSDIHQEYDIEYTEQSKSVIKQYFNKDSINYALGSMYGAFLGDALGSYIEFNHYISQILLQEAMQLPGGGTFHFLKPGQFTDDSQLASHILTALKKFDPCMSLNQQHKKLIIQVAQEYCKWYQSDPFDIGITTRVALAQIEHLFGNNQVKKTSPQDVSDFYSNLSQTFKTIAVRNEKSQSNGSLMRITPMAFFISLLMSNSKYPQQKHFKYYEDFIAGIFLSHKDEINMTHGNKAIFETSQAWLNLLVEMILRGQNSLNEVYEGFKQRYCQNSVRDYKNVQQWVQSSKEGPMDAKNSMGWAKIAFTHGLRQLRQLIEQEMNHKQFMNSKTYKNILRHILSLEGDTDTNAAIVGGLIGAIVGFKNLPYEYLEKQFALRLTLDKEKYGSRGEEYEPRREFLKAIQLIQKFQKTK